ncbi:MAG: Translation initiation factor IF-2 [bacterium]|nr:Translation initiation factor IF-2 [bacterium]
MTPSGPPPPGVVPGGGGRGPNQGKKLISGESRRPPKARGGGPGGKTAGRRTGGPPPTLHSSTEFRHVKDRRRRGGRQVEESRVEVRRNVSIPEYITIKDLSAQTGVKSSEIIKYLFRELSIMATINHPVDQETAALICEHLGIEYTLAKEEDAESTVEAWILEEDTEESLETRPPVVTVMGHVDHGKTKLLDAIRSTNVVAGESGGITQHIGAYRAFLNGRPLTFLDTPGHQAFTAMRARGAKVTDIAVLVVAADDGVMPQTKEAIDHAKAAGVEIIVALNKMDKQDANPDRVKTELANEGLQPSEWGGSTTVVPVSALKQEGIAELLEMILLQSEVMDLKANPNRRAVGTIIEARLDKGRGPVATALIEKGTLHQGDFVVIGASFGRIRAMQDENGQPLESAGPSCPVEISGLSDVPQAGDKLIEVEDEKTARAIYEERISAFRQARLKAVNKISLEDFHKRLTEGEVKELNIILKADVQGSIEALVHALTQLNTEEVKVNVVSKQVGNVKDSDLMLALASKSIVLGFKVQASPEIMKQAQHEGIDVRLYDIIYDAVDDVKKALAGLLKPTISEKITGLATVRAIFKVAKGTTIGGCYIDSGELIRNKKIRVKRGGEVIFEGVLNGLKRFKEDARKVDAGYECGIEIDGITTLAEGDIIEQFEIEEIARTLD